MADRLGVSYSFYGHAIHPRIAMMFEYEKKIKDEMVNRFVEKQIGKALDSSKLLEENVAINVN